MFAERRRQQSNAFQNLFTTLLLSSYLHAVVESLYVALVFLRFFLCKKKRKERKKEEEQAALVNVLIGIKATQCVLHTLHNTKRSRIITIEKEKLEQIA
jgi:hypothetical protein